jgi:hypothetical protein
MFRRGGSADGGITSGLRQGYAKKGSVQKVEDDVMLGDWLKTATLGDIDKFVKQRSYKPRGTNVYDFMTGMGINLLSQPAHGNIWQQGARASKEPYEKYLTGKRSAAEQEYGSESDLFTTILGAQSKILAAEEEGKGAGSGWLEQWKFEQIPILNKTIRDLTKKEGLGTITEDEKGELEDAIDQKGRIVKLDEVTAAWLKTKDGGYAVVDMKDRLLDADQKLPEEERKYKGKKDIQLTIDAIDAVNRELRAEGGRAGYANAGAVMPGQPMQAAMPTDQGSEAPPEIQTIDYETLRARLPNTITDDIVRLIASSAEAMEDFATIQTQQDISNFNKKYGVELILPAEA